LSKVLTKTASGRETDKVFVELGILP